MCSPQSAAASPSAILIDKVQTPLEKEILDSPTSACCTSKAKKPGVDFECHMPRKTVTVVV